MDAVTSALCPAGPAPVAVSTADAAGMAQTTSALCPAGPAPVVTNTAHAAGTAQTTLPPWAEDLSPPPAAAGLLLSVASGATPSAAGGTPPIAGLPLPLPAEGTSPTGGPPIPLQGEAPNSPAAGPAPGATSPPAADPLPPAAAALTYRSPAAIAALEAKLKALEFEFLGDADGKATWKAATEKVIAEVGDGFDIFPRNNSKLHRNAGAVAKNMAKNRWSVVFILCKQGGKPEEKPKVAPTSSTRKSSSKKIGCGFKINMIWPASQVAPRVSEEHARPRVFEHMLSEEEIVAQTDFIKRLHVSGVSTVEIHKALEKPGRRLGHTGKSLLRNMRDKFDASKAAEDGYFNDAQLLLKNLQDSACWYRFKTDLQSRLTCIAWAHPEQKLNAMRYHSTIMQDNTFSTNKYSYHLGLIVVVDKENHTQLAMQCLLQRERSEDFVFMYESWKALCEGSEPQVIFTDADAAATSAITEVFPRSLHKLCLYHTMENIRKHGRGLGQGVLDQVLRSFRSAAYAQTREFFDGHKTDLLALLPPGSHMHKYMAENIFGPGRVEKWASHFHPGVHTLGAASTQRVEGVNGVLKRVIHRNGSMVDVNNAILGKIQDDATTTASENVGGAVERVRRPARNRAECAMEIHRQSMDFITTAMRFEQCSTYAMEDADAEIVASTGYKPTTLAGDAQAVQNMLTTLLTEPEMAKLAYNRDSNEFIEASSTTAAADTLLTRTSVPHFVDLIRDQGVHELVRVTSWLSRSDYGHLVALGPNGFYLCTCLRQLVYGLVCRHAIIAMFNKRASYDGASVHPRWRNSGRPWPLAALAAKPARLAASVATSVVGGPAALLADDTNDDVSAHYGPDIHSNPNDASCVYATTVAFGKELTPHTKGLGRAEITRVLANATPIILNLIDVEKKAMRDALTSRVFTGVVSLPTAGNDHGTAPMADGNGQGGRGGGRTTGTKARGRGEQGGQGGRGQPGAGGGRGQRQAEGSGAPLRSLENVNGPSGGGAGGQVPPIPESVAVLENIRPPEAKKQKGQSRRHRRV